MARQNHLVMTASDLVILCSGTSTLEAALMGVPMIISYRVTRVSWLVVKLLLRTGVRRMFGMVGLGWDLLRTGRLSLGKETIRARSELARMLDAVGKDGRMAS